MTPQYRVRRFKRRQPIGYGFVGVETVDVQKLQIKRWWGWQTIEEEIIPVHVVIAIGCFGEDDSGWKSKFCNYGTFGRNGVFTFNTIEA